MIDICVYVRIDNCPQLVEIRRYSSIGTDSDQNDVNSHHYNDTNIDRISNISTQDVIDDQIMTDHFPILRLTRIILKARISRIRTQ